jgi:hypothetical protein
MFVSTTTTNQESKNKMTITESVALVNGELSELRNYCVIVQDKYGDNGKNVHLASRKEVLAEVIRVLHNATLHEELKS